MSVDYEPGDKLANGALVMRYDAESKIALCFWAASRQQPYVVWRVDDAGEAHAGSYFDELEPATRVFDERSS